MNAHAYYIKPKRGSFWIDYIENGERKCEYITRKEALFSYMNQPNITIIELNIFDGNEFDWLNFKKA